MQLFHMKFFHNQSNSSQQAKTQAIFDQRMSKAEGNAINPGFMHPNFAHWNWLKRSGDA